MQTDFGVENLSVCTMYGVCRIVDPELDVFDAPFAPLIMAEVEFGSKEAAEAFVPPAWFDKDVTYCKEYHNSYLALELHHAPENS